jgi:hypothetical protein
MGSEPRAGSRLYLLRGRLISTGVCVPKRKRAWRRRPWMRPTAPGTSAAPTRITHRRRHRAAARAYLTAAAEEPHQLNSGASLATILNDIAAFRVGHAFLNLHRLFANKAAQQIDQRAFIVIQIRIFRHPSQPLHFPFAFSPDSTGPLSKSAFFARRRRYASRSRMVFADRFRLAEMNTHDFLASIKSNNRRSSSGVQLSWRRAAPLISSP